MRTRRTGLSTTRLSSTRLSSKALSAARLVAVALLALPLTAPLTGCSLMGLDKFERARCTDDTSCVGLGALSPTNDECRTWQCEPTTRLCGVDLRDDDGDGAPLAMCAPAGVTADCDDSAQARTPGNQELCNLLDDDCDGVVDPNFAATHGVVATLRSGEDAVSFSRGFSGAEVSVLVDAQAAAPLELGRTIAGGSSALVLTPAMTDIADGTLATLAVLGDLGSLVVYDPAVAAVNCGADSLSPIQARWLRTNGTIAATTCLTQTRLAAASATPEPAGDVLLVWVEDAAARECGAATAAPVRARVLRPISATPARIDVSEAFELGTTADALGPSASYVDGHGWVIAHASAAGDVVVHRIATQTSFSSYVASAVTMISSIDAGAARDVTIAAGAEGAIAVAYADGDCAVGRVVLRLASLSEGSVTFGDELRVSEERDRVRRAPVPAFHAGRGEWVVVYRDGADEQAARFSQAGAAIASPVPLGLGTVTGRPYVEAQSTSGRPPSWGILAVTNDGNLRSATLACVESAP